MLTSKTFPGPWSCRQFLFAAGTSPPTAEKPRQASCRKAFCMHACNTGGLTPQAITAQLAGLGSGPSSDRSQGATRGRTRCWFPAQRHGSANTVDRETASGMPTCSLQDASYCVGWCLRQGNREEIFLFAPYFWGKMSCQGGPARHPRPAHVELTDSYLRSCSQEQLHSPLCSVARHPPLPVVSFMKVGMPTLEGVRRVSGSRNYDTSPGEFNHHPTEPSQPVIPLQRRCMSS